jgi:hypothetical protein
MHTKIRKGEPRKSSLMSFQRRGKKAIKNFNNAYKIFKNQTHAGEVLKVSQATINRYLSGALLVPLEVAHRLEIFTNGVIPSTTVFFDYQAYLYDLKNMQNKVLESKTDALKRVQKINKYVAKVT